MITKGIRGAITVDENTPEAIGAATIKLLKNFPPLSRLSISQALRAHWE